MQIKDVAVLGSGIMGHGIAEVAAIAGYKVNLYDLNDDILSKAIVRIKDSLSRLEKSGKIKEGQGTEVIGNIRCYTDIKSAVSNVDLVIEAVPEVLQLKMDIFRQLDQLCSPHTILATNTSGLSITLIGSKTARRDKIIGTHFFNPVVIMRLVEIICGMETSPETLKTIEEFCRSIGKETVVCKKDRHGFITTRLIAAQRVEAFRILEEGIATIEDIDKAVRLAFNHPMGPFELADFNGVDTGLRVLEDLQAVYGDRYRPPQFLKHMVECNYLGRKAGKGFYQY